MKSIFKSVALISVFSVLTRLLGFLLRIYLSRTIGAEALGLYQVALSVFMVLLTVVSSGLTLIISRMTASYRVSQDKKATASLITSGLFLSLAVSVILCVIILLFKNLFAHLFTDENCINILIILLPSLIFSAVYSVFRGAMWGNDNYFALCVTELFEMVIKIAFSVLLLNASMSVLESATTVAWSFTLSCIFSAMLVVILYFFYGGKMGKPTKIYKTILSRSAPITGVRIAGSLVQPLIALILPARLMVAGYTASQAMSIYGIALGMTFPLLFLPTTLTGSLSTALVPDISMAMAQNDSSHIQKRVTASINFTLFISFLVVPIFMAIGDKIGIFLYGEALSGTLLQFSSWIMIPMGVTNITSAILNSVGFEVKSFINYIIGGIFTFISVMWLTEFMGVLSLPFGMGVSTTITMILNIIMLKRKLGIKIRILKDLTLFSLLSLPTLAITSFVSNLFSNFIPLIFNLIISGGLGVTIYITLCLTFNLVNIHSYIVKFKEKVKIKGLKRAKK
ncbi:MAG TPA: oligosaccharide flippase family protein [Candidatus Caccovivens faecavium]|nr:oligosaccharide flippase family protein [Candidatus Caccovivens faecavium]